MTTPEQLFDAVAPFVPIQHLMLIGALILLDFALAIALAAKTRSFDARRVADFLLTNVIPLVIGYWGWYAVVAFARTAWAASLPEMVNLLMTAIGEGVPFTAILLTMSKQIVAKYAAINAPPPAPTGPQ